MIHNYQRQGKVPEYHCDCGCEHMTIYTNYLIHKGVCEDTVMLKCDDCGYSCSEDEMDQEDC